MNKKTILLKEFFSLCPDGICDVSLLTEDEKKQVRDNNTMFLTGIIQRADAENGNARIYPRQVLEREVNNYQKMIQERRALGELDHAEESTINLKNVSHMIVETFWKGNEVWGKLKLLNTPSGQIAKNLIKEGVNIGISSRALGSVREENGRNIVEDDLQLVCWDIVSDPSTHGAFLGLMENKQKSLTNSKENKLREILYNIIGFE